MRHGGAGGSGRAAAHGDNDACEDEGGGGKGAEANPDMMSLGVQTKSEVCCNKKGGRTFFEIDPSQIEGKE